jgi:SAM-dependent methyltransferase
VSRLRNDPRVRARVEALPPTFDRVLRPRRFRQRRLVKQALADPELRERFRTAAPLPSSYGAGLDERVVEHPWLLAQPLSGKLLDAGGALNHRHVVDHLLPRVSELCVATIEPEPVAFLQRRVSYVFADLRDLPFRDGYFDVVASISTLEHVGMDNTRYGVGTPRAPDPDRELDAALRELVRVLAPGGTLYFSVPYGAPEDHGWLRQFDRSGLERLIVAAKPSDVAVVVYRYAREGWQLSDLEAAADARYRDREREPRPPDDASNARAVACVRLTFGAGTAAG